jgi:peptidoglycan/xylan/chitin deacetylase (PgdA/CDA1 family)
MGCTAPSQAARHVAGVAVAAAWLSLAACHDEHWLSYPWDDRQIFCSLPVDDLSTAPDWDLVDEQLDVAARTNAVALMHAHKPGTTISIAGIERVLTMADQRHLPFLTYRELEAGAAPQAGLALAFDDSSIIEWYGIRDQLAAHRAHITLFITRWHSRSDEERAMVRTMADEGDDIEPHSVEHLDPIDYVHDHGIDAYMADEVIPSFDALTQAGYPAATIYAYPFGRSTDELNSAVLRIVPRVRVSPGSCPY